MDPNKIIKFIASKRPEKYSMTKIGEKSNFFSFYPYEHWTDTDFFGDGNFIVGYEDEYGKQGMWMNKKTKTARNFIDDKESDGPYVAFMDDNLSEQSTMKNGKLDGQYIGYYYQNENDVFTKGIYKNGKMEGEWLKFYENHKLKWRQFYINDNLNGVFEYFNPNGTPKKMETYKDNIKEGPYTEYFEGGYEKGTYHNDKKHGPFKSYYFNGKIYDIGSFENDYIVGPYEKYDENGKIIEKKVYKAEDKIS